MAFTDKTVTYLDTLGRESRSAICGEYGHFSPTWEDAKAWLIADAERRVKNARESLQRAQDVLGNAKGLKEPTA